MMNRGSRMDDKGRRRIFLAILYLLSSILVFSSGCSDNKKERRPTAQDRQDQAMRDPFGYSPNIGKPDISGGDIGTLDKDAMRKDLDNVFNP